jgi:predicted PurR-regulated permease PerM
MQVMEKHSEPTAPTEQGRPPRLRSVPLAGGARLRRLSVLEIASYLFALGALFLVLGLKLLGGLLAGMLVYLLVHGLAPAIERHTSSRRARLVVVVALAIVIVGVLAGLTGATIEHLEHTVPNLQGLFGQVMVIVDQARTHMPPWLANLMPVDAEQIRMKASSVVSQHMNQLQQSGKSVARAFGHVLFGMIIGAMVAVVEARDKARRPLAAALAERIGRFAEAFRQIVFAQVKISAINTSFTAVYLLAALPIFHQRLPLSKTLVLLTFIFGLLPVIGNLISNSLIVAVSLSISMGTAVASLVFLIAIHKLEYFLNAHIIGDQIEARAWELLLAMVVMEAAFGVHGVIAAPIFYAYIKRELRQLELV